MAGLLKSVSKDSNANCRGEQDLSFLAHEIKSYFCYDINWLNSAVPSGKIRSERSKSLMNPRVTDSLLWDSLLWNSLLWDTSYGITS